MTPRKPAASSEVVAKNSERTQRATAARTVRSTQDPFGGLEGCVGRPYDPTVQGVIKSYDPGTGDGVVVRESDLAEFDLAEGALDGSVFRMLRQGQRVLFILDGDQQATHLSLGSEIDMGTPDIE